MRVQVPGNSGNVWKCNPWWCVVGRLGWERNEYGGHYSVWELNI